MNYTTDQFPPPPPEKHNDLGLNAFLKTINCFKYWNKNPY